LRPSRFLTATRWIVKEEMADGAGMNGHDLPDKTQFTRMEGISSFVSFRSVPAHAPVSPG